MLERASRLASDLSSGGAGDRPPELSIIIPVYNGALTLGACLDALIGAPGPNREVVVVDDASQDCSADIAMAKPIRLIRNGANHGVSLARNLGANQSSSTILFFVDCDIVIHSDALERITSFLENNPDYSAVFGSYDSKPTAPTLVSQYRNLLHHFTHQDGKFDAETFWGGIGAVRRSAFCSVGGFRPENDGVEDVDFGLRLTDAGFRIALDRHLLGTHLKCWTLGNMIRTDIFKRARLWSSLVLERGRFTSSLNTSAIHKIGVLSSGLVVSAFTLCLVSPTFLYVALASVFVNLASNLRIYKSFALERGLLFALCVMPLHFVHQLCAGTGFVLALIEYVYDKFAKKSTFAWL